MSEDSSTKCGYIFKIILTERRQIKRTETKKFHSKSSRSDKIKLWYLRTHA